MSEYKKFIPEAVNPAVIDSILHDITDEDGDIHIPCNLRYGSKELNISYQKSSGFSTALETIDSRKRLPDETSLLYLAAKKLMEAKVKEWKKAAKYRVETSNPKMIEWAKTRGNDIFSWDNMGERPRQTDSFGWKSEYTGGDWFFEKTFIPETKEDGK